MSVLDPEGAERHMRDAEFTRMRQAQVAKEPPRVRVYAERPPAAEPTPKRRRSLARRKP